MESARNTTTMNMFFITDEGWPNLHGSGGMLWKHTTGSQHRAEWQNQLLQNTKGICETSNGTQWMLRLRIIVAIIQSESLIVRIGVWRRPWARRLRCPRCCRRAGEGTGGGGGHRRTGARQMGQRNREGSKPRRDAGGGEAPTDGQRNAGMADRE
jgi:hypothetical protein